MNWLFGLMLQSRAWGPPPVDDTNLEGVFKLRFRYRVLEARCASIPIFRVFLRDVNTI